MSAAAISCRADVADVSVPATVQAAIEARIDRLDTAAKRTLNAASVIGARFGTELLAALGIDPVFDELLSAELIEQVRFTPSAEYAFRHPLIRAVAYESQLKSDRAQWHRRLAAAIEERELGSVEENAALIAEHLQAAGELHAAYGWHMRAARVVDQPRSRRCAGQLGARPPHRRRDYPPTTPTSCRCASPPEPCCAPPTGKPERSRRAGAASRSCASCALRPETTSRWPSA